MTNTGRSRTKLFVLEFNELCPNLLTRFMDEGCLPNFKRMHDSSMVCVTDATEAPPNLEPWIQWVTVHNGLPFEEHGVHKLGEGRHIEQPGVARLLSDAGVRVGVFGSMNTNYSDLNGYYVPDPWDARGVPVPESLEPFCRVVGQMVRESSKGEVLGGSDLVRFGVRLLRNGLSAGTVRRLMSQLAQERVDPGLKWRRASLLDDIAYDMFRRLNRRHEVEFATLFCNSTAHYQHYYWRNMEPERFDLPPAATDHPSLAGAIKFGYQAMDRLVGRLLADYPDETLVLCTAMSQQPWTDTQKMTYRPVSFPKFLEFAKLPGSTPVRPVMAEEFYLDFPNAESLEQARNAIADLEVSGKPLMRVFKERNSLFMGCDIAIPLTAEQTICRKSDGATIAFEELFASIHTMRSGRHHPDGVLWIRNGKHHVLSEKVPLINVCPTFLSHFGVGQPAGMPGEPITTAERAVMV